MRIAYLLLVMIALLFTQCAKDDQPGPEGDDNKPSASLQELAQANRALAFDLFDEVITSNDESGKNVVVSPLSMHVALLMTLNGAGGDTYGAIANTLHSDAFSESSLNKAYAAYKEYVDDAGTKEALKLANAVFWDDGRITPDGEFADKMTRYYHAELTGLPFQEAAALDAINNWVDEQTQGRIEKILDQIGPDEVLFLINALYFKGDWQNPFPADWTTDRPFTKSDGTSEDVATMSHDAFLPFYQGTDYEAIDLPFGDSTFSMTFLRPADDNAPIDDFITSFDPEQLDDLYENRLHTNRVQVYLPRFETEYKINMNNALKALGMGVAFDPSAADLTRLGHAPEGNLFISRVEHKTFLKIDEKGAEGAAVSAVGVGVTSVPPTIAFDRPFMVVLRDIRYNSVVFIARIENPAAG